MVLVILPKYYFITNCSTPLHFVVCNGHSDVVELLLEKGCKTITPEDTVKIGPMTFQSEDYHYFINF